jgi:hypothetical protein
MKNPMKPSRRSARQTPPPIRRAAGWLGPVVVIAIVAVLAMFARPADKPSAPAAETAAAGTAVGRRRIPSPVRPGAHPTTPSRAARPTHPS